jgi:hypothetical protein
MLSKKDEKGKCPFRKLKDCIINVRLCIASRLSAITFKAQPSNGKLSSVFSLYLTPFLYKTHSSLQKEVGETKNVVTLRILQELGKIKPAEVERQAKKTLNLPTQDDLLLEE